LLGVNPLMWDTSEAGLKARLKEHAEKEGWDLARLAKETGDNYKNVLRWISGDTTVPGDFVGRYIVALPVDPAWLLTGMTPEGTRNGSGPTASIDEWGIARARAVEKLADLLLADQRVLEKRADAALNASIATRIEAEKAPAQNQGGPVSAETVATLLQTAQRLEELFRRPMGGGDATT
jgi:hypothetical protein